MKPVLVFLLAPWIVFLLPWSVQAWRRRWTSAGSIFAVWLAGIVCMVWFWFGAGLSVLVLTGLAAVFSTTIRVETG